MLRGEQPTIFGDGEQSRDFTYIDNAVEANLLACTLRLPSRWKGIQRRHRKRVTLNETFQLLRGMTSYTGQPNYGAERGGDIKHSLADISQAEKYLGYKPKVDFEEGLRRTVDWYRKS